MSCFSQLGDKEDLTTDYTDNTDKKSDEPPRRQERQGKNKLIKEKKSQGAGLGWFSFFLFSVLSLHLFLAFLAPWRFI